MSALSTLHPQQFAGLPLAHLAAVCNAVKNKASTCTSAFKQRERQQHNQRKEEEKKSCHDEARISSESLENARAALSELGLSELPDKWFVDCSLPVTSAGIPSQWHTSYVSAATFFENKHGFTAESLYEKRSLNAGHVLTNLLSNVQLQQQNYSRWMPQSVFNQRRGFKTKRSHSIGRMTSSGFKPFEYKQDTAPSSIDSILQNLSAKEKEQLSEKIDKAMKEEKIQDGERDSFKTGFVDGYLRSQKEMKKSDSYSRWLSIVLISIIIYCIYKFSFLARVSITTAQVDTMNVKNVSFDDVRGVDEAKAELQDIVSFLKDPEKYTALGGKLPKGVLLVGPPGTGKTLLARAVAGEAEVPFFYASGSEFDNMFVGSGARRVRELFAEAKMNTPCVVFIDELDSVGGKRVDSPMHPYSRQTINQLLSEMDGFKQNEGVIVMGATNFVQSLDPALMRPGRFDTQVTVPKPDVRGRVDILKYYLAKVKVHPDVNTEVLARGSVGFTGAELENLVNQAALKAAGDSKSYIDMTDLEFAKDKILMGPERKSAEIDLRNRRITAYHEGGHAIVAFYTKGAKAINKATIMPRGLTLGHVSLLPDKDQWNQTKAELLAEMDVCMGGRAAEELIFGPDDITTGAYSDFNQATKIARMMVADFGMSEKLGVMTYNERTGQSPETEAMIETEVRLLLKESYERAKNLLKTRAKEHNRLAEALLKYETLNFEEVEQILQGNDLVR
ncbi:ATP-dependent zinc metalloprotease YME1L1-like isoform X2 [Ptychodera flava]|uniref:ATP-dependent zinc metalloprotease YME1L1-like isoform X2 n=1 Tax=Ptychodera flava TaxID=63121 RepID=UPI00396A9E52